MAENLSFMEIINKAQTDHDAYVMLEQLRWPDGETVCPHCGNDTGNYYLKPSDGTTRKTRTGNKSQRRVHKCKECRRQFSAITNTVMHGTKISIRVWLLVIFEMCASKNGVSAREVERKYDLTPKSAWYMLHRIRAAMESPDGDPFVGTVLADETYVGGKIGNRSKAERAARKGTGSEPVAAKPGERNPSPGDGKAIVLSLLNEETGEVRSRVVNDVTGYTLRKAIAEQTHLEAIDLVTDEGAWYRAVGREAASHETVNHSKDEFARKTEDGRYVSTNAVEGYFSQLKRSIDGTHHHVSHEHLHRYLAEFDYRYSTRNVSDAERMRSLLGRLDGKRLSYRPLLQAG